MSIDLGSVYGEAFRRAIAPRPELMPDAWADAHRILSREEANEHGKWDTGRTPTCARFCSSSRRRTPARKAS